MTFRFQMVQATCTILMLEISLIITSPTSAMTILEIITATRIAVCGRHWLNLVLIDCDSTLTIDLFLFLLRYMAYALEEFLFTPTLAIEGQISEESLYIFIIYKLISWNLHASSFNLPTCYASDTTSSRR